MKVLKNAKSEMPTMLHSSLPSMERMLLQCPNTSMNAPNKKATGAINCYSYLPLGQTCAR